MPHVVHTCIFPCPASIVPILLIMATSVLLREDICLIPATEYLVGLLGLGNYILLTPFTRIYILSRVIQRPKMSRIRYPNGHLETLCISFWYPDFHGGPGLYPFQSQCLRIFFHFVSYSVINKFLYCLCHTLLVTIKSYWFHWDIFLIEIHLPLN